jgi:hypothetical protein
MQTCRWRTFLASRWLVWQMMHWFWISVLTASRPRGRRGVCIRAYRGRCSHKILSGKGYRGLIFTSELLSERGDILQELASDHFVSERVRVLLHQPAVCTAFECALLCAGDGSYCDNQCGERLTSPRRVILADWFAGTIEVVGMVEAGISAARWSPDNELLALLTGSYLCLWLRSRPSSHRCRQSHAGADDCRMGSAERAGASQANSCSRLCATRESKLAGGWPVSSLVLTG